MIIYRSPHPAELLDTKVMLLDGPEVRISSKIQAESVQNFRKNEENLTLTYRLTMKSGIKEVEKIGLVNLVKPNKTIKVHTQFSKTKIKSKILYNISDFFKIQGNVKTVKLAEPTPGIMFKSRVTQIKMKIGKNEQYDGIRGNY